MSSIRLLNHFSALNGISFTLFGKKFFFPFYFSSIVSTKFVFRNSIFNCGLSIETLLLLFFFFRLQNRKKKKILKKISIIFFSAVWLALHFRTVWFHRLSLTVRCSLWPEKTFCTFSKHTQIQLIKATFNLNYGIYGELRSQFNCSIWNVKRKQNIHFWYIYNTLVDKIGYLFRSEFQDEREK